MLELLAAIAFIPVFLILIVAWTLYVTLIFFTDVVFNKEVWRAIWKRWIEKKGGM